MQFCLLWGRKLNFVCCEAGSEILLAVRQELKFCLLWGRNCNFVCCEAGTAILFSVRQELQFCLLWGRKWNFVSCEAGTEILSTVRQELQFCLLWGRNCNFDGHLDFNRVSEMYRRNLKVSVHSKIFTRIRKIEKLQTVTISFITSVCPSDCTSVRLSVCSHGTTRLLLNWFS